MTEKPIKI